MLAQKGGVVAQMVAHLTAILQSRVQIRHPSTCRSMSVPYWGANRVGIATAGWPLRGGRGTRKAKIQKNNKEKRKKFNVSGLKRVSEEG